ncbi:hypothetical protein AAZX31_20G028000 [Glycine max]|uniref:Transmembrane protein n=1 Tax=Glycine max TaxID=3847 RepID=I1NDL9_SOYBN|nr:uncharacterized protein LOC100792361 [Glycine max]KAG4906458.1 hypothetical protein JHK86_054942 [Glycine max]KAG4917633.1 hypothetical protein JHK85_055914 [Glycine max]KAG5073733.1 hypothetical protein JHK84_054964 [Glycine max]KAG5076406.1 hypothetical protein JHK82_055101 [Glycine max]KAH1034307.1 hypothetical protein GYH30_054629 [Glycine max]|eukprot:XP_003556717.1 uncharacterized protein LOC100792361 [Glycine max]
MAPQNLCGFISQSQHIMKAHLLHFYTLSLLFLFPISSSFILSPTLFHLHQQITTNTNPSSLILFLLLYSLFISLFSTCGVISITNSVFHFFINDQPAMMNLRSAIKSIPASFFPFLTTTFISQAVFICISFSYALLLVLLTHNMAELARGTGLFFVAFPLLIVLMYLQVNWTLVPVIVVVESCWGLEPFRRSARLIKGMKGVALSSLFFYGFCTGSCALSFFNGITFNWAIIVICSFLFAMIMASNIAVNTVLYIYCKANHGENIADKEFGREYVNLAFHDGNSRLSCCL